MSRPRAVLALAIPLLASSLLAGCADPEESGDDPLGDGLGNGVNRSELDGPNGTKDGTGGGAPADPTSRNITLELVVEKLDRPLQVAHAGDGSGRLFIVGKTGTIEIWKDGALLPGLFLDLRGRVQWGGEQGLLGLAFHPGYETNGLAFVSYTERGNAVVIARFKVDETNPDRLNPQTGTIILRVPKEETTHNGGTLAFGPDGKLYVSLGDGGGAGDPEGDAQNPDSIFGKILRLDVDAPGVRYAIPEDNPFAENGGRGEVWHLGLRNPWRFSFDRETGDMWIGDVGQNDWEEVNFAPSGAKALNFGWNIFEGPTRFKGDRAGRTLEGPAHVYSHDDGCAIAGGFVYRGARIPALRGAYLYSDLCAGTLWALDRDGDGWKSSVLLETSHRIVSFGEDEAGELYVMNHDGNGAVYRIVPVVPPT